MTASSFASLGSSTFTCLVKARQNYVALQQKFDAAADACTCTGRGRCTCEADESRAWQEYQEAGRVRAELESVWSEFQAIRWS